MAAHKWTPVRIVKVWLDLTLVAVGIVSVLLLVYLLFSSGTVLRGEADVAVVVAIGHSSFLPRMPLELAGPELSTPDPESAPDPARASLVKCYGELRTVTSDWGLHFSSMFFLVFGILIVLYIVWELREIVRSTLAGEPFAPSNSLRLRRIGFIVLVLAVVHPTAEYLLGRTVLERLSVESLDLSPAFRFSSDFVLVGLLFLVLSAIFRHGTQLEEERSLTV